MKWPFRRKQEATVPAMPPEVQQYYQAEQRERTGVAWLLAGITLVVTVLVVMGLFFGGRWAYRKSRHTDSKKGTVVTTTQPTAQSPESTSSSAAGSTPSSSSTPAASTPTSTTPSASSSSKPSNTTSTSQGVVGPTAARTEIPNTGPGDTVALFVSVSIFGYLAHRVLRRS